MADITDIIVSLGQIGLWLKAVGVIFILWIVFGVINFLINRKRIKELYNIKEDMKRMEKKLDKIIAKKK